MKKILDLATVTAIVLAIAGFLQHYEMGKQVEELIRTVVSKLAPWVNSAVYS